MSIASLNSLKIDFLVYYYMLFKRNTEVKIKFHIPKPVDTGMSQIAGSVPVQG